MLLWNFKDIIFFPYPAIVGNYRARYNEMNTPSYLEQLREYARDVLKDPIDNLTYLQLLKWEQRHLLYWGGALAVRPEMPIEILSTNLFGTVELKNGEKRYAILCTKTNTLTIILSQDDSLEEVKENSFEWWNVSLGRCGEFALLYNGLLLANGIRSRIVVDCSVPTGLKSAGDHVWNEVFDNGTWWHVDPTEGVFNKPTMYVDDWGKEVNKVYAIEGNTIEDVTKFYAGT